MHVIPHLEHGQGTFFPDNGMVGITRHLHALGVALGVDYRFGHRALRIEHDGARVTGVHVKILMATRTRLQRTRSFPMPTSGRRSAPCPTSKLRKTSSDKNGRHGVIFIGACAPSSRTYTCTTSYSAGTTATNSRPSSGKAIRATTQRCIHISSKLKFDDAPQGGENWFVMVNVGAEPAGVKHVPQIRRRLRKIERTWASTSSRSSKPNGTSRRRPLNFGPVLTSAHCTEPVPTARWLFSATATVPPNWKDCTLVAEVCTWAAAFCVCSAPASRLTSSNSGHEHSEF